MTESQNSVAQDPHLYRLEDLGLKNVKILPPPVEWVAQPVDQKLWALVINISVQITIIDTYMIKHRIKPPQMVHFNNLCARK